VLVGGSTRIPLGAAHGRGALCAHAAQRSEPDEVVALGAAVQADILVSGRREMLLLDVTPLSLGIETMGGVVSKIILRNSTIPASGREMFTSGVDNQTAVDIHVLQGERELAATADRWRASACAAYRRCRWIAAHRSPLSDRRQRHSQRRCDRNFVPPSSRRSR
jgi:molecular chaperone DnaK (HSP70)